MPARKSSQSIAEKDLSVVFSDDQKNFILYTHLHNIKGDDAAIELNRFLAPQSPFKIWRNALGPMQKEIQRRIAELKACNISQSEATSMAVTLKDQALLHSWGDHLKRAIENQDKDRSTKQADARKRRMSHDLEWFDMYNEGFAPAPMAASVVDQPYPGELSEREMADKLMSLGH